jgi:DNA-binding beta-propeller fold protein YncE
VGVIDVATLSLVKTIETPPSPQETLVRPDGKYVYVSCDVPGKVAAIRTSDWAVETVIDAGKYADGLAWATR